MFTTKRRSRIICRMRCRRRYRKRRRIMLGRRFEPHPKKRWSRFARSQQVAPFHNGKQRYFEHYPKKRWEALVGAVFSSLRATCGNRCPKPRKKPWDETFKERTDAYAAYESSDAYVEPEKKQKRNKRVLCSGAEAQKRSGHTKRCLLRSDCGNARNGLAFAAAMRSTLLAISLQKRFGTA